SERWYRRRLFHFLFVIACWHACFVLPRMIGVIPVQIQLIVFSAVLFVLCMVCNGELVRLKPQPDRLTSFYLIISAGGAAGGVFVSLLAPLLFRSYWEYHIGLVGCGILLFWVLRRDRDSWLRSGPAWLTGAALLGVALLPHWWLQLHPPSAAIRYTYYLALALLAGLVLMHLVRTHRGNPPLLSRTWLATACIAALMMEAGYLMFWAHKQFVGSIFSSRNFYGEFTINDDDDSGHQLRARIILHAQVRHGSQLLDPAYRRMATTYYSKGSGVGAALLYHPHRLRLDPQQQALKIGVIGLGAGTLAAYGRPGDSIRFYEINPDIIRVATGPEALFSYIGDSPAQTTVVPGDARLSLEQESNAGHLQNFDVLVVDAFNSDSIPVHLLTKQAFELYLKHLGPDGLLAIHATNYGLDLTPVVMGLAQNLHLEVARFTSPRPGHLPDPASEDFVLPRLRHFIADAQWIVLARDSAFFQQPEVVTRIDSDLSYSPVPLWTDDYSNLFLVLRKQQPAVETAPEPEVLNPGTQIR
ncbi:MAG TPA: hypothetical protein VGR50_05695, partial [Terriglobales bacterium]|nr:hypothetical protein [Terriglobales bacterium]